MTSFGATEIVKFSGFQSTFKVQGQVYHLHGSLLPSVDESSKFLQIYFIGDENLETDQRCSFSENIEREIVENLQKMFHDHNELVKMFRTALEIMPKDNYQIVIKADKVPSGEHERRYNAPTIDDVAIVIVGTEFEKRDIIIRKRDSSLKRVTETHRSYDALQYPILFAYGEDGYHINLKQVYPNSQNPTSKKVIIDRIITIKKN